MHKWTKLPDTDHIGIGKQKNWHCNKCGCRKELGYYKFATPMFVRSGVIFDYTPPCIDMGRRSTEPLD